MANEPIQGLPYPDLTGVPPNVPADIKALADAVAPRSVMRFASIAARDAALPAPVDGMVCFVAADNGYYARVGGEWVVFWSDTGWVDVPLRPGFTNNVTLQVRSVGEHVYCKGRVAGSFTTGNVIIGDIPAGFRPVGTVHRPALTFNTNAAVTGSAAIGTDGTFNVSASTAGAHIVNVFTQWLAS